MSVILFLSLITSSAGALELDSMLWRLRSQRVIIIIIIIIIILQHSIVVGAVILYRLL